MIERPLTVSYVVLRKLEISYDVHAVCLLSMQKATEGLLLNRIDEQIHMAPSRASDLILSFR